MFTLLCCHSNHQQIYIGDDNALTLEISAENQGEGAYETELHVYPPQQADFTGVGAVHSQVTTPTPTPTPVPTHSYSCTHTHSYTCTQNY